MAAPTIAALPSVPSRQRPTTFSNEADAFLNTFPTLRNEINAFSAYLNSTALVSYAFADGTAGLPTIRFENDSDTGIFRPAANALAFTTGGMECMRINGAGNIGFGTGAPDRKVHIKGAVGSLKIEGTSLGSYVELTGPGGSNFIGMPASVSAGSDTDMAFYMVGFEAMRIAASGNIGVGTASINGRFQVATPVDGDGVLVRNTNPANTTAKTAGLTFEGVGTGGIIKQVSAIISTPKEADYVGSDLVFKTRIADTLNERLRLDSAGNLLLNTQAPFGSSTNTQVGVTLTPNYSWFSSNDATYFQRPNGTSGSLMGFFCGAASVGGINVTPTATGYNTSSDYRLKEDWRDIVTPSETLMRLKPGNFAWKIDGSRVDGFLAHEVAEIIPNAVTGKKDETEEDGAPVMQSVDHSKIVPLLTAALQEALKRIEALEAHVAKINGSRV